MVMTGGPYTSGNAGSPAAVTPFLDTDTQDVDGSLKLAHDRYEVYVNGDFVGRKVLLNPADRIEDVVSFLHSRGFNDLSCELEGDHFGIRTDATNAPELKQHLHVYLHTR